MSYIRSSTIYYIYSAEYYLKLIALDPIRDFILGYNLSGKLWVLDIPIIANLEWFDYVHSYKLYNKA